MTQPAQVLTYLTGTSNGAETRQIDARAANVTALVPTYPDVTASARSASCCAPARWPGPPHGCSAHPCHHNRPTCRACLHRLPAGTCGKPVEAGLIPAERGFGIVWPPVGHASNCMAWSAKPVDKGLDRPYRLSRLQADAAHIQPWDEAVIGRFRGRVAAYRRRGFGPGDADDLAELAHLLDVRVDDRRLCLDCTHLAGSVVTGWRCRNHLEAGVSPALAPELVTQPMRCAGFTSEVTP